MTMISSRSLLFLLAVFPVVSAFVFNFLGSICLGRANILYWIYALPLLLDFQTYHQFLGFRGYKNGDYKQNVYGMCEVLYASHEAVGKEMELMVEKLDSGDAVRSSNLGLLRIAKAPFTCSESSVYSDGYCGIGLGLPHDDHSKIRPFLDESLGTKTDSTVPWVPTGAEKWNLADIKTAASAFLMGRTKLNMGRDPGNFFIMQIHKIALNIDLTEDEADDFASFCDDFLRDSVLPQIPFLTKARSLREKRGDYIDMYISSIKTEIANGDITALDSDDVKMAANAFLDAMIYAAYPSLSGASAALSGVYLTNLGDVNDDITWNVDVDLGRAIMESVRVFPPVLGIPYVEGNTRYESLAGYSGYDKGVFGDDAFHFRIRFDTQEQYQVRSRNWADKALPVSGKPETSHVCPARSFAFNLLLGFFAELDLDQWMEDGDKPDVQPSGSGPAFWDFHDIVKV